MDKRTNTSTFNINSMPYLFLKAYCAFKIGEKIITNVSQNWMQSSQTTADSITYGQCGFMWDTIMLPALQNPEHLFHWVGLRPGRKEVLLELETIGNHKILIHNYGHGGSGVTLTWGCATDVVQLLSNAIKSKL